MAQSHIGQILATKGQSMPINKNTIFHSDYNNRVYGFNQMNKVVPYGYQNAYDLIGTTNSIPISIDLPNAGTIELWYKPRQFYDYNTIWDNSLSANDWECWIYATGLLAVRTANNSDILQYNLTSLGGVNDFYHIAFSWNKTGNINLFVNGVLRATKPTTWIAPGGTTYIGGSSNTKGKGAVSDIRIWSYERTETQIKNTMDKELSGTEQGLVRYYKLNEGTGSIVVDSALGNDVVISSASWTYGRTVATIRPEGKFNSAVAVEEGTTNLISNPFFLDANNDGLPDSWAWGGGGAGDPARTYRFSLDNAIMTSGNRFRAEILTTGNSSDTYIVWTGTPVTVGATYTFSMYVRSNVETILSMRYLDSANGMVGGGDFPSSILPSSKDFTRIVVTTTAPANAVRVQLYCRRWGTTVGHWVEIEGAQFEQKAFPTSVTNGTRPLGTLLYDSSPLVSQPEGTVAFWYKPTNIISSYSAILRAGKWANGSNGWSITKMNGTNQLYFEYGFPGVSGSVFSSGLTPDVLEVGKWVFIVGRWKTTGVSIDVFTEDGVQNSKSISGTTSLIDYQGWPISIGKDYPNSPTAVANGLFSEIRIDTICASDDEVLAWYQSNAPFYNYLDYSGEA